MQATGITPQLAEYDVALVHTTFSGEKEYILLTMWSGAAGTRAIAPPLNRCWINAAISLRLRQLTAPIPIFLSRATAARLR